jgi:WD40 repeat protein
MQQSPYRNLFGEETRYKYYKMDLCKATTDGNKMAVNNKFMALSWNYDRGAIAIFNPKEYSHGVPGQKLFKGHKGKIFDLKFSPFRTDLLASASEDCTVRLWQVPEEGLKEDIRNDVQMYTGHTRKVSLVAFNHLAADVIASASVDYTIQVWNMIKSETYATCKINGNPTSLDWNDNGSLIAASDSNKKITVFDPRANKEVLSQVVTDGRGQKFVWTGDDTFAYVGISKRNEREFKHFDIRKIDNNEICRVKIDEQLNLLTPYFDRESKLLYTVGKGEANVNVYDFNEPVPRRCLNFATEYPASSFCMIDRRYVDYNKNEIDRMVKWTASNEIMYVSFYVLKRNVRYEPSLYPHLITYDPTMTYDEWISGENKTPVTKEINQFEDKFYTRDDKFVKKEIEKVELTPQEKYKKLQDKLIELEQGIQKLEGVNAGIEKRIKDEESEVERLEKKLAEVLAEC